MAIYFWEEMTIDMIDFRRKETRYSESRTQDLQSAFCLIHMGRVHLIVNAAQNVGYYQ